MNTESINNVKTMYTIGIIGGTGYTARELLRILLQHPQAKIVAVTSRSEVRMPVSKVHTSLLGVYDEPFIAYDSEVLAQLDVIFLTVPHTESMGIVQELCNANKKNPQLKVIDIGTDFRLQQDAFEQTYNLKHTAPELLQQAVYGMPELNKKAIATANLLANPGCFAHCTILGLAPLAQAGVLQGTIHVSAVTGSSGSGTIAKPNTHHPLRAESMVAYSVLEHRHVPEIEQALIHAGAHQPKIQLVPQSGPFVRGIFAVSFVTLEKEVDVLPIYTAFAQQHPFIRMRAESPRLQDVRGTNFCDIAVKQSGKSVVVISAIDNLIKGASGNAIQCMNLMLGLDEKTGLHATALSP
ncbi:N-acetyl-gamma-glutamyl-phosphate reductase [Candidatus Woesearchaeota archaeon]|nr:N-acetyl-gamma-glutamyl-phosphate reductase [Candidatus Woesearchaeota archaeon]